MVSEHRGDPSSDFQYFERQECQSSFLNLPNQIGHMNITASIGSLGFVSVSFVSHPTFICDDNENLRRPESLE